MKQSWGYNSMYLQLEMQETRQNIFSLSGVFLSWSHSVLTSELDLKIRQLNASGSQVVLIPPVSNVPAEYT